MFRITQYMKHILQPTPLGPKRYPSGPVVIWNLIRRCNLTCKHCYSISADKDFPNEVDTDTIMESMYDLFHFGVPVLILSGGEPLLHPDIFEISAHAKALDFYVGLSTNGTLINESNIREITESEYDYVGISIDGMRETHDKFRRKEGSFDAAMNGIRICRDNGIKVGLRFTMTQDNANELPDLLKLMDDEGIDKFYFSHLNYAGRGDKNRKDDVAHKRTRDAMDLLFEASMKSVQQGTNKEFVTGNNDADGVYLLHWVRKHYPDQAEVIQARLEQWGGNSSGVNISNIDNLGNVHPDTMWWNYNLGNIKERPFSEIWTDESNPLMAGLKANPRPLRGRCSICNYRNICGGNTRTRAFQMTGDPWWEDPGCYLGDDELGINPQEISTQKPEPMELETRVIKFAG
jgi:heme d1 biosynthesis radical SAM protein NirJ